MGRLHLRLAKTVREVTTVHRATLPPIRSQTVPFLPAVQLPLTRVLIPPALRSGAFHLPHLEVTKRPRVTTASNQLNQRKRIHLGKNPTMKKRTRHTAPTTPDSLLRLHVLPTPPGTRGRARRKRLCQPNSPGHADIVILSHRRRLEPTLELQRERKRKRARAVLSNNCNRQRRSEASLPFRAL
jgi:hypothetical protein